MLPKEPEFQYPDLVMPPTVERTAVKIWSNGVALDADIYRPKDLGGELRVPAIVLCHGWGGSKASAERYAAKFAAAGMVSLCFTHAGWSFSGSRALLTGDQLELNEENEGVAKVRVIREVVDPVEWMQSYRSAVDYIEGEPNVDPDRIGAWGTSFGGGIVMHTAANDRRIKALAVQVAAVSSLLKGPLAEHARQRAIDAARGNIPSVPQGIDAFPRLAGTPNLARFLHYSPIEEARKLKIPTLMLDAGNEEMFDIKEHCGRAYEILKSNAKAPARYKVIEGIDHYGMYFDGFDEGSQTALQWFAKYL